jgi:hypothetical protein
MIQRKESRPLNLHIFTQETKFLTHGPISEEGIKEGSIIPAFECSFGPRTWRGWGEFMTGNGSV